MRYRLEPNVLQAYSNVLLVRGGRRCAGLRYARSRNSLSTPAVKSVGSSATVSTAGPSIAPGQTPTASSQRELSESRTVSHFARSRIRAPLDATCIARAVHLAEGLDEVSVRSERS